MYSTGTIRREVDRALALWCLFGHPLALIGWIFLTVCFLPMALFLSRTDIPPIFPSTTAIDVPGIVTSIEKTNYSEGGSKRNRGLPEHTVYSFNFEFELEGTKRFGRSYQRGLVVPLQAPVTVTVEPSDPDAACIKGFRRKPFGSFLLFMAIFPLVGALLAGAGFVRGRRSLRLLEGGAKTFGKITERRDTSMRVNNRQVVACTLVFQTALRGQQQCTIKTHQPELLGDSPDGIELLYDADHPQQAQAIGLLPGRPVVSDISAKSGKGIVGPLIAPTLVVVELVILLLVTG